MVWIGKFWLSLWVRWFVVMFGDAVVVVRWFWYRLFGWFLVVCCVICEWWWVLVFCWVCSGGSFLFIFMGCG